MRIRYTIPIKRELIISDHWDIPIQGGTCRVVEENGRATALEIVFTDQPLNFAPHIDQLTEGPVKITITGRDQQVAFVKRQLDEAMAFLHCFHDIDLKTDEIQANYEGETPEEEEQIAVKAMSMGKHKPLLSLTFDMLTRAIMAAEKADGPKFEATLASTARKALSEQQFINSFRYSFLLIESLYGEGQFKSAGLKSTLKSNPKFVEVVDAALKDTIKSKPEHTSDTSTLLSGTLTADDVIDHLVDKRGFYFHGNVKRRDAWKPDEQGAAEALALLAISIAQLIAQQAAAPMFEANYANRHFEDAKKVGAEIVFQIKFKFREPEEKFQREHQMNFFRVPGTKVTPRMALKVAQHFFENFEHNLPVAALESAACTVQDSGEKVFDIQFHTTG
jgi:hypothetical protein